MRKNSQTAESLIARVVADFPLEHEPCPIGSDRALDNAILTAPEARDPELLRKLGSAMAQVNCA